MGFKWGKGGGGLGASTRKTHWGMCLLNKIMILQWVKQTFQPLEEGYANMPKKAQKGGVCGVFPYIQACLVGWPGLPPPPPLSAAIRQNVAPLCLVVGLPPCLRRA